MKMEMFSPVFHQGLQQHAESQQTGDDQGNNKAHYEKGVGRDVRGPNTLTTEFIPWCRTCRVKIPEPSEQQGL